MKINNFKLGFATGCLSLCLLTILYTNNLEKQYNNKLQVKESEIQTRQKLDDYFNFLNELEQIENKSLSDSTNLSYNY